MTEYIHRTKEQKKQDREKFKNWLNTYKKSKGCEICGWNDFVEALHVHHKNPVKRNSIQDRKSFLVRATSIKAMKEKLKDCFILCPRCHRLVHNA